MLTLHVSDTGFVVRPAWVLPNIFTTLTLTLCHSNDKMNSKMNCMSSKQPSRDTEVKQHL